ANIDPWLLISHEQISLDQLISSMAIYSSKNLLLSLGSLSFKFEPMIMHVEARSLNFAQKLLKIAVQSGFRNSGISFSSKRIIVAVRCTLKLDVPILFDNIGNCLLSEPYLEQLTLIANEKMKANNALIEGFYAELKNQLSDL